MKSQGVSKTMRDRPLETMNIHSKLPGNLAVGCRDVCLVITDYRWYSEKENIPAELFTCLMNNQAIFQTLINKHGLLFVQPPSRRGRCCDI